MISLWTTSGKAAAELRKLFKFNIFELNTADAANTEDILSVISPVVGQPKRMWVYGLSIHISEVIPLYIQHPNEVSNKGVPETELDYEEAVKWLSTSPLSSRQIPKIDFIKSHHGMICFKKETLSNKLAIAIHKRLGRPVFIINPTPFAKTYGLEYRFSLGMCDLARKLSVNAALRTWDHKSHSPLQGGHSPIFLILNAAEIDLLQTNFGDTYLHKLKQFLQVISNLNSPKLHMLWQANNGEINEPRRESLSNFIKTSVPQVEVNWQNNLPNAKTNVVMSLFALSAYSGLPASQKLQRWVHTLQKSPFDGIGATQLWDNPASMILESPPLRPEETRQQTQALEWLNQHYFFKNAFQARTRFKSVIQNVIVDGIPKG